MSGLSPVMSLLAACSRLRADKEAVEAAARAVPRWDEVLPLARHHLMVPLLHHHLAGQAAVPADVVEALQAERKNIVRRTLLQQAELRQLVLEHLQPRGIRYIPFKGVTLSARYYGDPMLRQCRDIDVLVEPARLCELIERLVERGYRLRDAHIVRSGQELRAYSDMMGDVGLISPRGVLIELHQRLDYTGCQYPVGTEQLFAAAQTVAVGGDSHPVLPTTELFLYICYHHSRHQWSRLHWAADLDAIVSHESFDIAAVLKRADELGMSRLVCAVLALYRVLGGRQLLAPTADQFTDALVGDCLGYLREESEAPEKETQALNRSAAGVLKVRTKIFTYNWRANTRWRNRLCYLLSLTRGGYPDYRFMPLPRPLFPLYRLIRPLRWLLESLRIKRIAAGRPSTP